MTRRFLDVADHSQALGDIERGLVGALGGWIASTILPARTQGAQIGGHGDESVSQSR